MSEDELLAGIIQRLNRFADMNPHADTRAPWLTERVEPDQPADTLLAEMEAAWDERHRR